MSGAPRVPADASRRPLAIALTGGIASGKSAVSRRFADHGVPVIDADVVARDLVAPGGDALAEIAATFGADVLDSFGALDRERMRARIFTDPDARRRLEAILHPRIRQRLRADSARPGNAYVIVAIPLLAESDDDYAWLDRVVVVDVPRSLQMQRLLARDGIDAALATRMIEAQASRAQRLALADDVIDNSGTLQQLHDQVDALHGGYMTLASGRRGSGSPGS